jgi:phage-related protein
MEVCVDIDEELLCEFDRAAQAHNITRNAAARGAIAAWLSQTRRDAALSELFDTASSGADPGISERACSGVFEIALPFRGNAFRVVYGVQIGEAIWVVHAFQKKSTQGIKTPKHEIDLVKARIKRLKEVLR